jgi:hypothetical protein
MRSRADRPGETAGTTPVRELTGAPDGINLLIVIAAASHLVLPWITGHFPYQDIVNHLTRYTLIDQAWHGHPAPWVQVRLVATPYIAVDVLGATLVHLCGPHLALRVLATLTLGLMPLGMYLLLRAVAPRARGWTLVAILLSASPFFLKGLLNYQLGIGATLVWAAFWWPRRERASLLVRAGLVVAMALLVLIHLSAAVVAMVLISGDAVLAIVQDRHRGMSHVLRTQAGRLITVTACGATALLLVTGMQIAGGSDGGGNSVIVMQSPLAKLVTLSEPFFTFTPWEMLVTATGYVLALATAWRMPRATVSRNPFRLATMVLVALFLISPASIGGASHLEVRWLLPLALLALVPGDPLPGAAPRTVLQGLAAACLVHAAVLWQFSRQIDRELDGFDWVLHQIPRDARVLSLVGGPPRYFRVEPYLHYALWHTVETGSRTAGLFTHVVDPVGRPRVVSLQFAHLNEVAPAFAIFDPWRKAGAPPLPWAEVRRQYDVVIQAGADSLLASMLTQGGCPRFGAGAVTAIMVGLPCDSTP